MRVLHLLYDHPQNPWVGGGGSIREREVNRRLAGRGVEVVTLAGAYPGSPERAVQDGVVYEFLGVPWTYPASRLSYALAARAALTSRAYDVAVVDFSAYTPIRLPSAPRRPAVAVVHHVTGTAVRERWGEIVGGLVARGEAARLSRFRWISADSEHTREEVRKIVPPAATVRLIGNAVEPALFEVDRREADPPFLLYLGRLDVFHKGLDVLLEAFERFGAEHPGVELRVAGRGKDLEAFREMVEATPLRERVRLLGAVSDAQKLELLSGALAVAMPSRMEGWGLVAAEAMAAGAPLVASRAGSLPEVTGGDRGALLVPPGEAAPLHDALAALADDPVMRAELGARARAEAQRRFSWDAVAEQHHQFLLEVIASTR